MSALTPEQIAESKTFLVAQLNYNDIPVTCVELVADHFWMIETPEPVPAPALRKTGSRSWNTSVCAMGQWSTSASKLYHLGIA